MAEIAQNKAPHADAVQRFLTFRLDSRLYALPAGDVSEVIRVPSVARLPQSPAGLMGMANLRGSVLPVASLRALLGREAATVEAGRAIVLDGAMPVALTVDMVDALISLRTDRIETRQTELATIPGELLRGAFQTGPNQEVAKILDVQALLAGAFAQQKVRPKRTISRITAESAVSHTGTEETARQGLVTFEVAGQEYAFDLGAVQEITQAPRNLAVVPRAESLVLGVTAFRDTLLPLLSLRGLLGFPPADGTNEREKVIVTAVGGVLVGLVVDRMRAIVHADARLVESTPSILAARAGGETKIKAIYRGNGGRRLISILTPDQLFREDVMQRLGDRKSAAWPQRLEQEQTQETQLQFLVFRLGDEEFGLPVGSIDEVARVPNQVTKIPKTPKFLEGVVNLRGEVLPVIDQRKRFEMPKFKGERERQRLVVVRTENHRAGLIVDSVSEVLRVSGDVVEEAPALTGEKTRLVEGVINLESSGRMVLLLDPAELLNRAERKLLDAFDTSAARAPV